MYAAREGVIPSNLFAQDFPFEALITDAYQGRAVKVKTVTPWTFNTDTPNGLVEILPSGTAAYLAFVTSNDGFWSASVSARYSAAGKDTIVSDIMQLSGKMILFDELRCFDTDNEESLKPFQCIGFKIDIEGATGVVPVNPAGGADYVAGFFFEITLDGAALGVGNVLTNIAPFAWQFQTDTAFKLEAGRIDYGFTIVLPKLGGVAFADDYSIGGTGGTPVLVVATDNGDGTWTAEIDNFVSPLVADGTIVLTSLLSPGGGGMPPGQKNLFVLDTSGSVTGSVQNSGVGGTGNVCTVPQNGGANLGINNSGGGLSNFENNLGTTYTFKFYTSPPFIVGNITPGTLTAGYAVANNAVVLAFPADISNYNYCVVSV